MSVIWKNSTKSGLCDRLIDLFLMSAFAKLTQKNLILEWHEQPINKHQNLVWNPIRRDDYKIQNFLQYFTLPNWIIFRKTNQTTNQNNIDQIFTDYLGAGYSPITFYEKYVDRKYSFEEFYLIFNQTLDELKPTEKLLNLIKPLPDNLVSIHLRRTDKCYQHSDIHGIKENELNLLDQKTHQIIDHLINHEHHNLFFCSDDFEVKKKYSNDYQKYNIITNQTDGYVQTYIDMWIMINSQIIILSQKHSSFSLFCSLKSKNTLIYTYNDGLIQSQRYPELKHIMFYENLLTQQQNNNKITIKHNKQQI